MIFRLTLKDKQSPQIKMIETKFKTARLSQVFGLTEISTPSGTSEITRTNIIHLVLNQTMKQIIHNRLLVTQHKLMMISSFPW